MADYGVNIQVAVKNSQAVTQLAGKIKETALKVDQLIKNFNDLADITGTTVVNSVRNCNKALSDAGKNLNKAALGTKAATEAARDYVDAQNQVNAALKEQQNLLRAARLEGKTVSDKPFGPKLPQGFDSEVGRKRALAQRVALETAAQVKISEAERKHILRIGEIKAGLDQKIANAQYDNLIKAGQIEERLDRIAFERKKKLNKENLDDWDRRYKQRMDQRAEDDKRRVRLAKRQHELITLRGQTSPIGGAVGIPGSPAALAAQAHAKRMRQARGSALIGGAFPLLFGQGLGASIGGAAGGAGGALLGDKLDFGLSLAGTALGAAVDNFVEKTAALAKALDSPIEAMGALADVGIKVSNSTQYQIESLVQAGRAQEAQALIFKEISDALGPGAVSQLAAYEQELSELDLQFNELSNSLRGDLLPALVAVVAFASDMVKIAKQLRFKEGLIANLAVLNPASVIGFAQLQQAGEQISEGATPKEAQKTPAQLQASKDIENNLRQQVKLQRAKADLSRIDKKLNTDAWLVAQQLVITQEHKIENEAIYVRFKREGLSDSVRQFLVENNNLKTTQKRNKAIREHMAIMLQLSEQALKTENDRKRAAQNARVAELSSLKALNASAVALTKATKGKLPAIMERIGQLAQERDNELAILGIKYKQASAVALSVEEAKSLHNAYLNNYDTVVNTYKVELEKNRLLYDQARVVGIVAKLSAVVGDNLKTNFAGFIPTNAPGILEPSVGSVGFAEGGEMAAIIQQEIALQRVLEKYQEIGQAAQLASQLVTTGFVDMVSGARSAEEVFADFLNSLANMLIETAQRMIAQYIALGIARAFGLGQDPSMSFANFAGSMNANPFSGNASSASGFLIPHSEPRALGGPVSAGRPYMVGERGPELFVPGAQGNVVPNGSIGGVNVGTINISVENTGDQLTPQAQKQLAGQVKGIVLNTLANERRSGGML